MHFELLLIAPSGNPTCHFPYLPYPYSHASSLLLPPCMLPVHTLLAGPLRSAYDLLTACHDLLESGLGAAPGLREQLGTQAQVSGDGGGDTGG